MRVLNKYKLILCEVMLGMDFGQQQMLLFLSLRKNAFLKEDSKEFCLFPNLHSKDWSQKMLRFFFVFCFNEREYTLERSG